MGRIAQRVVDGLMERRGEHPAPPGGSQVFTEQDATGFTFTVLARGDAFEVYAGRRDIHAFPLEASSVARFVRWYVWTWWVRGTWCGLKRLLWRAALRKAQRT